MSIAYILDSYPALSESFIDREIAALRACGLDIEIFALNAAAGATQLETPSGLAAAAKRAAGALSPALRTRRWREAGAHWWRSLEPATRARLTHIHGGFASHPAAIAWGAAQESGLPFSFSAHARDLFVPEFDLAALAAAAEFVTACTRSGATRLAQLNPSAHVVYVPHGLPLDEFSFAVHSPATPPLILSVGRLVPKKGILDFVEALASLVVNGFDFSAAIVGEGPQGPPLAAAIDAAGLAERVELKGALPRAEVARLMQNADCLVFTGRLAPDGDRDGLPNVLLEAAALGLPIVSTTVGGITDFLDVTVGWPCQAVSPGSIAEAISARFADPTETSRRAAVARARVEEHFDARRNIALLAELFAIDERSSGKAKPLSQNWERVPRRGG